MPEFAANNDNSVRYNGHVNPWTESHSWLVFMGGSALADEVHEEVKFLPAPLGYLTPTTRDLGGSLMNRGYVLSSAMN